MISNQELRKQSKPPELDISENDIKQLIAETHNSNTLLQIIIIQNKEYILKSVRRDSIETQEQMTHLYNERQALWELEHESLNKLIGTSKDTEHLHFILELVEGITLDKLLKMHHQFNPDMVYLIVYQVAQCMKYMHDEEYIHRDIKASNIIIDQYGRVTLIDFGFSKKIGKERTYSFCGTTHMMSPEFFESDGYSYGVDHYALGILLHELLQGTPPFGYEGSYLIESIKEGIQYKFLVMIEDLNSRNIIEQLLEKNALKRLGVTNGFDDILNHQYFQKSKENQIINKIMKKYQPTVNELFDLGLTESMIDDIRSFGINREVITEEQMKINTIFNDLFS